MDTFFLFFVLPESPRQAQKNLSVLSIMVWKLSLPYLRQVFHYTLSFYMFRYFYAMCFAHVCKKVQGYHIVVASYGLTYIYASCPKKSKYAVDLYA